MGRLLHSLHIDPRTLPGLPDAASWDAVFRAGGDARLRHPSAAADVAAGSQLAARAGAPNGCAARPSVPYTVRKFFSWQSCRTRCTCVLAVLLQLQPRRADTGGGRPACSGG